MYYVEDWRIGCNLDLSILFIWPRWVFVIHYFFQTGMNNEVRGYN